MNNATQYFDPHRTRRTVSGIAWRTLFYAASTIAVCVLAILILNIINGAFGYVAITDTVPPEELTPNGRLENLSTSELIAIAEERLSRGLIRRLNVDRPLTERTQSNLVEMVIEWVVEPRVTESWTLVQSIFNRQEITQQVSVPDPDTGLRQRLDFRVWITPRFLVSPQSPVAEQAGVRTAIFGSLWMMAISIVLAFPIGVATAIYLGEYAKDTILTRLIGLNIYNLAGIPSIIYGLLGLTIFVRALEPITSGVLFGIGDTTTANGRTIISAGATLALLILPIIIINAQEAIRAVPQSLRDASYGVGGTKWQTIWYHVIPYSFDRILTGVILAVSRAVGETAPLIVVGASTFITADPTHFFRQVHHPTNPDLPMVNPPADLFSECGGRGDYYITCPIAVDECLCHSYSKQDKPEEETRPVNDTDTPAEKPIIEIRNLNVFYGEFQALRDVNLSFFPRKVCALIGPSGCGKSTVLRTLNRMNDLIHGVRIEGIVEFEGQNIYAKTINPVTLRRRIGMVFQKPNPFPKSIYENIAWGARINGFRGDYDELVERSLQDAGLWDEVKDTLNQNALRLSGGQQQRLCIARTIAVKPEVILMDEPASALDPIATGRIEALINELKVNYTIIIITHNLQQAGRVSDSTSFFMVDETRTGYLAEHGRTADLFIKPKRPETEAYISGRFG